MPLHEGCRTGSQNHVRPGSRQLQRLTLTGSTFRPTGYAGRRSCPGRWCRDGRPAAARFAPIRRITVSRFGEMPTTLKRRLISLFTRSSRLVLCNFERNISSKAIQASTSCWASSMILAARSRSRRPSASSRQRTWPGQQKRGRHPSSCILNGHGHSAPLGARIPRDTAKRKDHLARRLGLAHEGCLGVEPVELRVIP